MDNLVQLLINGFDLDYIPPDVTVSNAQELANVISSISENNKETIQANNVAKSFYLIQKRANAVIEDLKEQVNAKTSTVDGGGKVVDLLTTDEYLKLMKGSPNLLEISQMRLFESHHLSEKGDLNVFVYEDAIRLRDEMITTLNSKSLIDLVVNKSSTGLNGTLDPSNPASTLLDYYKLKSVLAEKAMSSVEDASVQPKTMPQYMSMVDSTNVNGLNFSTDYQQEFGSTASTVSDIVQNVSSDYNITNSLALLSAANKDKNLLKQCRATLKLLSAVLQTNLYAAIDDARNYATRSGMRIVNQMAADATCTIYARVINPILNMMRQIEQDGQNELDKVLKRVAKVNKRAAKNIIQKNYNALHSKVFESVYKYMYTFQMYITELSQEDESFYIKHTEKSARIADLRETRWFIQQLDEAIALLDEAAASGDMNYFMEAYAFNLVTDTVYDYSKDQFDSYRKYLKEKETSARTKINSTVNYTYPPNDRYVPDYTTEPTDEDYDKPFNTPEKTTDEIMAENYAEWDKEDEEEYTYGADDLKISTDDMIEPEEIEINSENNLSLDV